MKALKIIGIILLALFVLYTVVSLIAPKDFKVERTVLVKAPKEAVFTTIGDLSTWPKWSSWSAQDTTMTWTFSDPPYGEGAWNAWSSKRSGNGKMEYTAIDAPNSFKYSFQPEGWEPSDGWINLSSVDEGTTVNWGFEGAMGFFFRPLSWFMDGMVGPSFQDGLERLDAYMASMPTPDPVIFELVNTPALEYFSIKTPDCPFDDMAATMGNNFTTLYAYLGADTLVLTMPPFTIYHTWNEDNNTTTFESCVQAVGKKKGHRGISRKSATEGQAFKAVHIGSYDGLGRVYEASDAYIDALGYQIIGGPWEVYVTQPDIERDTSKWITEVYFPVALVSSAYSP